MPKTQLAGEIEVGGTSFTTNAIPDTFDLRDLDYRPMLRPLPPFLPRAVIDSTDAAFRVLTQEGRSCTGHAVAAVVNAVLVRQGRELDLDEPEPVSPYMLYRLARRYDEFPDEADLGSSLRGAFKGWMRHGIALDREWAALAASQGATAVDADLDHDDPDFTASSRLRPLGAYYRVNPYRLDDMQSAINELHAIAASAAIHTGWKVPIALEKDDRTIWIIDRGQPPHPAGGHAFAIVGYNEFGFVVQNSWGPEWGDRGFAILTYEDWLESAYDAWVVRPGVPNTPLAAAASTTVVTTAGALVSHGGANLALLRNFVVTTGNDGRLADLGRVTSSDVQLDGVFDNMAAKHGDWTAADGIDDRHVVLYAHGGLVGEDDGRRIAQRHLGWWLNNHVYPVNFVWQSGAIDTLFDAIADLVGKRQPAGGVEFDREEGADRVTEGIARLLFRGLWGEMKQNAAGASERVDGEVRGATAVADRLRAYRERLRFTDPAARLRVHLVGHSAGAIFLTHLADRLRQEDVPIESIAFMGGAVRADLFASLVLPMLGSPALARFTTFGLTEKAEQDDVCTAGPFTFYHKSLLYLVALALERRPDPRTGVVPLIGLEHGLATRPPGLERTYGELIEQNGGRVVLGPAAGPPDGQTKATSHGAFDGDEATLTSIVARILEGTGRVPTSYRPNQPAPELAPAPNAGDQAAAAALFEQAAELETYHLAAIDAGGGDGAVGADDEGSRGPDAEADVPDGEPGDPKADSGPIPTAQSGVVHLPTEAAIAPRTSPNLDVLLANGWRIRRR